jgi:flagellar FliJ protein
VLRLRRAKEDEKKREFGTTVSHLKHEQDRYDRITNTSSSHDKRIEKTGKGKVSVRNLINNFYYARHLDKRKTEQKKVVQNAQKLVDEKRAELVEATKKKKVLERLKERKLEEYNKAALKEEQALIDEAASQRFNHEGAK